METDLGYWREFRVWDGSHLELVGRVSKLLNNMNERKCRLVEEWRIPSPTKWTGCLANNS